MTLPSSAGITQYPQMQIINAITQSSPAVITLNAMPHYVANQFVRIKVPSGWGMPQINNQIATVLAVDEGAMQVTININTTNYFAFNYPVGGFIPGNGATAQLIPVGDANGILAFPFNNLGPNPVFP